MGLYLGVGVCGLTFPGVVVVEGLGAGGPVGWAQGGFRLVSIWLCGVGKWRRGVCGWWGGCGWGPGGSRCGRMVGWWLRGGWLAGGGVGMPHWCVGREMVGLA